MMSFQMNSKKHSRTDELLLAISGSPTTSPTQSSIPQASSTQGQESIRRGKRGRTSSVSLNDEDTQILRNLSSWLAAQGCRVNDTLILRTALRMATTGAALLEAYDAAVKADKRLKK